MIKRIITILTMLMVISSFLTACTNNDTNNQSGLQVIETTTVIETTSDGGTVEKDSEDNIITKDKNGNILAVKDKNGESLDLETYVASHPYVRANYSPEEHNNDVDTNKSKDTGTNNQSMNTGNTEAVEEEIPTVIVEISDDNGNVIEMPDL